jgi:uncharacterized protein YjiS (DUF1127 family)
MTNLLRRWRRTVCYRTTVRELRSLSSQELRLLGIDPNQISHLAAEVARL